MSTPPRLPGRHSSSSFSYAMPMHGVAETAGAAVWISGQLMFYIARRPRVVSTKESRWYLAPPSPGRPRWNFVKNWKRNTEAAEPNDISMSSVVQSCPNWQKVTMGNCRTLQLQARRRPTCTYVVRMMYTVLRKKHPLLFSCITPRKRTCWVCDF